MKERKWILIPLLTCAFSFVFFVFHTNQNQIYHFIQLENKFLFYDVTDFNSTQSFNQTKTAQIKNWTALTLTSMSIKHRLTNNQMESDNNDYFICPMFGGGFGNMMFQFASTFGIAMSKNMSLIVSNNTELNHVFKLNVDLRMNTSICNTVKFRMERTDCAYDKNLLNFNRTQNLKIGIYLQSWKYFYKFRNELRKQLTFRDSIQLEADETINKILKKFNFTSRAEVTLVGVHIRRGDMVDNSYGYNTATPEYLSKSVQYFKSKYKNVIFVVSTQDIKWTNTHMPKHISIEYISFEKREMVVAALASCNHMISTVGTFGWWIGWLTGGEVTYFKWPAKEGSELRKQFSKDFSDFFYPGWIGI